MAVSVCGDKTSLVDIPLVANSQIMAFPRILEPDVAAAWRATGRLGLRHPVVAALDFDDESLLAARFGHLDSRRARRIDKAPHPVVEAVGPLLNECIALARFGGRVILFGHDELARPPVPQAEIMRKELQVSGVWLAKHTFVPAIRLLERGVLPMDDIISHVMPLDRILEAHDMMRSGKALKIVIDPVVPSTG